MKNQILEPKTLWVGKFVGSTENAFYIKLILCFTHYAAMPMQRAAFLKAVKMIFLDEKVYFIFAQNRLWVYVRTASLRRF